MKEKDKSWVYVHKDEILSDNSHNEYCKQCKRCKYRDDGTVWSNHYIKASWQKYKFPKIKPLDVINNINDCPYHVFEQ